MAVVNPNLNFNNAFSTSFPTITSWQCFGGTIVNNGVSAQGTQTNLDICVIGLILLLIGKAAVAAFVILLGHRGQQDQEYDYAAPAAYGGGAAADPYKRKDPFQNPYHTVLDRQGYAKNPRAPATLGENLSKAADHFASKWRASFDKLSGATSAQQQEQVQQVQPQQQEVKVET